MTPIKCCEIIKTQLNNEGLSFNLVKDIELPYTPYLIYEIEINSFAKLFYRIHVSKRHKYILIKNNCYIRIKKFDILLNNINYDFDPELKKIDSNYLYSIGTIYYNSLVFFETFLKQSIVTDVEFIDDNSTSVKLEEFTDKFIIDSNMITKFLQEIFCENFVKSLYIDYKSLFYRNGDLQKLFLPHSDRQSGIIELLGMHFYNPSKLPEAIIMLNNFLGDQSIDDYNIIAYNKLIKDLCVLNDLDFEVYKFRQNVLQYKLYKIGKWIYELKNHYNQYIVPIA